jgi:hypothetical protein
MAEQVVEEVFIVSAAYFQLFRLHALLSLVPEETSEQDMPVTLPQLSMVVMEELPPSTAILAGPPVEKAVGERNLTRLRFLPKLMEVMVELEIVRQRVEEALEELQELQQLPVLERLERMLQMEPTLTTLAKEVEEALAELENMAPGEQPV